MNQAPTFIAASSLSTQLANLGKCTPFSLREPHPSLKRTLQKPRLGPFMETKCPPCLYLDFYPTFKLVSWPVAVSCKLPKRRDSSEKRGLTTYSTAPGGNISVFAWVLLTPSLTGAARPHNPERYSIHIECAPQHRCTELGGAPLLL